MPEECALQGPEAASVVQQLALPRLETAPRGLEPEVVQAVAEQPERQPGQQEQRAEKQAEPQELQAEPQGLQVE